MVGLFKKIFTFGEKPKEVDEESISVDSDTINNDTITTETVADETAPVDFAPVETDTVGTDPVETDTVETAAEADLPQTDQAVDAQGTNGSETSWYQRLRKGLARTSHNISDGLTQIVGGNKLDEETLIGIEELLIQADFGLNAAEEITEKLAKCKIGSQVNGDDVKKMLANEIETILAPVASARAACAPT